MDTKEKELVGDFKNAAREWHPQGRPEEVRVHDFLDKKEGKAVPYGVYDLARDVGWVSVGVNHDTAAFAVQTIRYWWRQLGRKAYPRARSLLITADSESLRHRRPNGDHQSCPSQVPRRLELHHQTGYTVADIR